MAERLSEMEVGAPTTTHGCATVRDGSKPVVVQHNKRRDAAGGTARGARQPFDSVQRD